MRVKILKLNEPTSNGRIYSEQTVGNALKSMEIEGKKSVYGHIGEPDLFNQIDLTKISHYVTDMKIENGYLVGSLYPMSTPKGKVCEELINSFANKDDLPYEFVASGVGFIEPLSNRVTDYTITSVNMVMKPEKPV